MSDSLLTLPDEQLAPFSPPDEADVRLIRHAVEVNKRRLNEATPIPVFKGNDRSEL